VCKARWRRPQKQSSCTCRKNTSQSPLIFLRMAEVGETSQDARRRARTQADHALQTSW
jgi:hypothetical protein